MSKPVVLVFAGPNGSGKSTVTKLMPIYGAYVNADDLKKEYDLSDIEAAQKAELLRNKLLDKNADFTFETVLSTERNLLLLKKAKEKGYTIFCIYILTCNAMCQNPFTVKDIFICVYTHFFYFIEGIKPFIGCGKTVA